MILFNTETILIEELFNAKAIYLEEQKWHFSLLKPSFQNNGDGII